MSVQPPPKASATDIHPKVAVGGLLALLTAVVTSILASRGYSVTPEETSALTAVVGIVAGYLTPSS